MRAAQAKLKELGYPIGDVDGVFGPQMRVAVLAFEAENSLVYDGALESVEHKMLMADPTVKSMPVGSREEITVAELKARGSETIAWTTRGKNILKTLVVAPVAGVIDKVGNDGDGAAAALDTLEATRTTATRTSDIFGWVLTPLGLGVCGLVAVLILIYFILDRVEKKRLKDARSGANIAR